MILAKDMMLSISDILIISLNTNCAVATAGLIQQLNSVNRI